MKNLVANLFVGEREICQLMRSLDWSQTLLGSVERWSPTLKTLVRVLVSSPVPTFILWGNQQAVLVNEACADMLGVSYASAIGHPANLAVPELWATIHSLVSQVISTGESVSTEPRQWPGCCGSTSESQLVLIPIREDESTETGNSIENSIAGVMGTFTALLSGPLLSGPQSAQQLQIDHRQMALALAMGNIGTWQLNIETQELSASEQGRLNFGIAEGESATLSKKAEGIHPEDKERVLAAIENAIANRTNIDIEYRTLLHDGSIHWLVVRGQMACNSAGEPTKMVGISTDITRRKQSENRVKESERRSRRIVDSNMFGVLYGDITGGIHYANDYFSSLLGYTDSELTSGDISWDQLTPAEYATLDQQAIEELKDRGVCTPYEKVFQHREGHPIPVLVTAAMLQRPYDETQQVIGVVQNLTALKQVEADRDRFFDLSPDIFAIAGDQGYFLYVSQAWETILGFTPAEVITTPYMDFIHPDDVEKTIGIQQKLYEGFDVINFENRYRHKDGSYRWIDWNVTTLQNESKFYCAGHDITQRKQRETEREQLLHTTEIARANAERANRIKDEFLAVISHELRSPLNPILGWTQILKRGGLSPERTVSAIASIERNAKLQVQLIGDLLDISCVLRGKLSLTETPIKLRSVVLSALETVQTDAEAKSIEIHTALTPCFVNGDNVRLQQAVWNLLSNAVKFTPHQGQISVTLKPIAATTENSSANNTSTEKAKTTDYAEITITDTGKGISAEFLPYVFEHFRQEDYSTTRQFGGLGLGLAIVRQVIELHEGSVSVNSAGEGKGATFTMRLPLIQTAAPLATKPVEPQMNDLSGVSVLIVDDNPDSLEIAAFGLELAGAMVSVADSGTEALRILDQAIPDILISDIGMPDMDGYTLIEQIRARAPERGGNVLAIALTAYVSDTEATKAVEAGFQRHLAKPAGPDELAEAISELLNR